MRQGCVTFRLLCVGLMLFVSHGLLHAGPKKPLAEPRDEKKFFRRTFPDERRESFFNYGGKAIVFELNDSPLPFLDWALVECGHVGWMGEAGDVVPLADDTPYERQEQIIPVPFSVASGIELCAQPATKGPTFEVWFKPTLPWEQGKMESHQIHFDADAGLYRLWYRTTGGPAYAESKDLTAWTKPLTSEKPYKDQTRTNLLTIINQNESGSWLIHNLKEVDPARFNGIVIDPQAPANERYKTTFVASSDPAKLKAFSAQKGKPLSPMVSPNSANCVYGAVSADGIAWRVLPEPILLHDADTFTVTRWDPARESYVMFTRLFELGRRTVARSESKDFRDFPLPQTVIGSSPGSHPAEDFYSNAFSFYPGRPELMTIFCMHYDRAFDATDVRLWFSRDGMLWNQEPGGPVIAPSGNDTWDGSFVQVQPSLIRAPDGRMMVFYSGNKMPHKFPRSKFQAGGTGIATWPSDRLVALEAEGRGEFTTPYLRLAGPQLVLNCQTQRAGEIRVGLFDENFDPIPGHTLEDADPIAGDDLARVVTWRGASSLAAQQGKLIFIRFQLRGAKLFAISAGESSSGRADHE